MLHSTIVMSQAGLTHIDDVCEPVALSEFYQGGEDRAEIFIHSGQ